MPGFLKLNNQTRYFTRLVIQYLLSADFDRFKIEISEPVINTKLPFQAGNNEQGELSCAGL